MSGKPLPAENPESRRQVVIGAVIAAVVIGAIAFAVPRVLNAAAGPEAEILVELKSHERDGIELQFPFGVFTATQLQYSRMSVVLDSEESATVRATLDLNGKLTRPDGSVTLVSSLGIEKVPFGHAGSSWEPTQGPCPTIQAAVTALEARRVAIEKGELALVTTVPPDAELSQWLQVKGRRLFAKAWYLRNEREDLTVSEDYRLTGDSADKPVEVTGTKRLTLKAKGAEFFFPQGLM
ncbi:MAG: hypothetical protein QM723_11620 [Myxococcaceae bacterium]